MQFAYSLQEKPNAKSKTIKRDFQIVRGCKIIADDKNNREFKGTGLLDIDLLHRNYNGAVHISMENGIDPRVRVYSGGLGILSGDTTKSFADLGFPFMGASLLYNQGYFDQQIKDKWQHESYTHFDPREYMIPLEERVSVNIEGRDVKVRSWLYQYTGESGYTVPILYLDTNGVNGDRVWDEGITGKLYKVEDGDNNYWRIAQEIVLGVGTVRMLEQLNKTRGLALPDVYHINEGHGALATIELLKKYGEQIAKGKTVFTTHTPVPAGHDQFNYEKMFDMMQGYFDGIDIRRLASQDVFNTTILALNMSRYANGVAQRHGEVSRKMFPGYKIDSITNGVHSYTWTSDAFKVLYDKHMPEWRRDPEKLSDVDLIPAEELLAAHNVNKLALLNYVKDSTGVQLDEGKLTIGFARRFATYKRGDLIFSDLDRLLRSTKGNVQFIYSGKAHPADHPGKEILHKVLEKSEELKGRLNVAFLENYDMRIGKILTSGVDVWLNLPRRPLEASGTSGMKAAHNGVLNFSTNDGWWDEVPILNLDGEKRRQGGWSIGPEYNEQRDDGRMNFLRDDEDAHSFYNTLEQVLCTYQHPELWMHEMRGSIRNAAIFNTQRMAKEYIIKSYGLEEKLKELRNPQTKIFAPALPLPENTNIIQPTA